MLKLSANLSTLYPELPFLDRFERAARDGFRAVEVQFPYVWPAREIRARLDGAGLALVLHNLPAGNWDAGERGIACHPGREREFRDGVAQGIAYAQALGTSQLNCLSGKAPPGVPEADLRRTFVDNLRFAARATQAAGLRLLIEPVNTHDVPGAWLHGSAQALDVLDEVGADNAFLQYDVYHMQRMEGELAATIERKLARIGHIQISDNPGRHEPGSGEINFAFLFRHLQRIGYQGWIGCEYNPVGDTTLGLGWRERLLPAGGAQ